MALPLPTPKPPPPPPRTRRVMEGDDFAGIEDLDRTELDDAPDTERTPPTLPSREWAREWAREWSLDWDDQDGESGVKRRSM